MPKYIPGLLLMSLRLILISFQLSLLTVLIIYGLEHGEEVLIINLFPCQCSVLYAINSTMVIRVSKELLLKMWIKILRETYG